MASPLEPDRMHITLEAIDREIRHLKALQDIRFELFSKIMDTALDGIQNDLNALIRQYQTGHNDVQQVIERNSNRLTQLESIRLGGKESQTNWMAWLSIGLTVAWIGTVLLAWVTHH